MGMSRWFAVRKQLRPNERLALGVASFLLPLRWSRERPARPELPAALLDIGQRTRDLLARVISRRVVVYYAQSGAGKSSLINARLLPGLRRTGFISLPSSKAGPAPAGAE